MIEQVGYAMGRAWRAWGVVTDRLDRMVAVYWRTTGRIYDGFMTGWRRGES